MLGEARNPGIRAYIAEHTRNFLWHACIETQVATCVVRVWRRRSARHGSGCTRGSICRARAGACSCRRGGVRRCGGNEASDHGRRSGPITMIVTSVGRGDVGPFRCDGTNVRRTAEALVAIGDGADTERARVTCSSAVEDNCGTMSAAALVGAPWPCSSRCSSSPAQAVARAVHARAAARAGDGARSPSRTRRLRIAERGALRVRRARAATARSAGLAMARSAEPDARRLIEGGCTVAAATADGVDAKRGDASVRARTRVGGARSDGRANRPTLMTPDVKHEESGRCREAPAAWSRRAPLTRPSSASPVSPAAELCRRGCR